MLREVLFNACVGYHQFYSSSKFMNSCSSKNRQALRNQWITFAANLFRWETISQHHRYLFISIFLKGILGFYGKQKKSIWQHAVTITACFCIWTKCTWRAVICHTPKKKSFIAYSSCPTLTENSRTVPPCLIWLFNVVILEWAQRSNQLF